MLKVIQRRNNEIITTEIKEGNYDFIVSKQISHKKYLILRSKGEVFELWSLGRNLMKNEPVKKLIFKFCSPYLSSYLKKYLNAQKLKRDYCYSKWFLNHLFSKVSERMPFKGTYPW